MYQVVSHGFVIRSDFWPDDENYSAKSFDKTLLDLSKEILRNYLLIIHESFVEITNKSWTINWAAQRWCKRMTTKPCQSLQISEEVKKFLESNYDSQFSERLAFETTWCQNFLSYLSTWPHVTNLISFCLGNRNKFENFLSQKHANYINVCNANVCLFLPEIWVKSYCKIKW